MLLLNIFPHFIHKSIKKIRRQKIILLIYILLISRGLFASYPELFNSLAKNEKAQAKKVVRVLNIKKGSVVADLGAGGGYFTVLLARAVGSKGMVYALDISKECINYINRYIKKHNLKNVKTILSEPGDSRLLKNSVDLVFIRTVYHHMDNRIVYFTKLKQALKPGGKIVIIEYRHGTYGGHNTKESTILREMTKAGYKLYKQFLFLEDQSYNVFVLK